MTISPAIKKLEERVKKTGSPLCIGLDSDIAALPPQFLSQKNPQFAFNKWIIDQTHQYVSAYKMNVAFYEARGAAGWQDLEKTQEYITQSYPDIFTIADAKRADIDSTNLAYATAFFDNLSFDAVTLHPYLGREALQPFLSRKDKACIILCKTSNPGSGELQDLLINEDPLWKVVAKKVATEWNDHGNCMVVVGATYPEVLQEVRAEIKSLWMLVPGVGTQGGDMAKVIKNGQSSPKMGVLVSVSRGIIFADDPSLVAKSYTEGV